MTEFQTRFLEVLESYADAVIAEDIELLRELGKR